MGTANNIISEWELIHAIDLTALIENLENTEQHRQEFRDQLNYYKNACSENTDINKQLSNMLKQETKRANDLIKEIMPTHRTKRGIFDFIGTIEKTITGTLDAEDGKRYETNFNNLFKNQEMLKGDIKNQISITKNLIDETNSTISTLIKDHNIVIKDIQTLKSAITKLSECAWTKVATNTQLALLESVNEINDYLNEVITAQTFARHTEMHPSIIKPIELQKELLNIQQNLEDTSLLFEPTLGNIPKYQETLKVNTYQNEAIIYFIIKIPLIEKTKYDYYQLYPIPNENNQIIIPTSKFILLSEETFIEQDELCLHLQKSEYLCEAKILRNIKQKTCSVQLITYSTYRTCLPQTVSNFGNQIIKIDNSNTWILVAANQETLEIQCTSKTTQRKSIFGNYIISLPFGCKGHFDSKILLPKFKSEYSPSLVIMPNVKIENEQKIIKLKPLNLTGVDMSKFNTLKQHITNLENQVNSQELIEIQKEKINWMQYTIPCILLIIISALIFKCFPKITRKFVRKSNTKDEIALDVPSGPY